MSLRHAVDDLEAVAKAIMLFRTASVPLAS
jgi:hypothetical protein